MVRRWPQRETVDGKVKKGELSLKWALTIPVATFGSFVNKSKEEKKRKNRKKEKERKRIEKNRKEKKRKLEMKEKRTRTRRTSQPFLVATEQYNMNRLIRIQQLMLFTAVIVSAICSLLTLYFILC